MKGSFAAGLLAGLTVGSPGLAQVSSTPEPEIFAVNAMDLHRARRVIARFFATERRPECYQVLFSTDHDGTFTVTFAPRGPRILVIPEGDPVPAVARRCGMAVEYVLDRRGNVLRRTFPR